MTATVSGRDRRAMILGGVVVVGLVIALRGVPAWRAWRSGEREFAVAAGVSAVRTDHVVASFASTLDTLEARSQRLRSQLPLLFVAATGPAAAGLLAALVGEQARGADVRLDGVRARVGESDSVALVRLFVDAQATGDIEGLARLLRGLETATQLVAVRHLNVQPETVDGPDDRPEVLSIRFTVEARALLRPKALAGPGGDL